MPKIVGIQNGMPCRLMINYHRFGFLSNYMSIDFGFVLALGVN